MGLGIVETDLTEQSSELDVGAPFLISQSSLFALSSPSFLSLASLMAAAVTWQGEWYHSLSIACRLHLARHVCGCWISGRTSFRNSSPAFLSLGLKLSLSSSHNFLSRAQRSPMIHLPRCCHTPSTVSKLTMTIPFLRVREVKLRN